MIKKHIFKSGVTALFLCSFIPAAFATTLHTAEDAWLVRPIAPKKGSEPGYCSMKNHFKNAPTIIIARDTASSNAIALDFHKDMFETGIRYTVKASTGAITRQVDALAASKQVLLLQMGTDTEFYNELAHRHTVTFTAGKNSYGFDFDVSVADALTALNHCSASLEVGMTFAEASFPLGVAHAETPKQAAQNAVSIDAPDATADSKAKDNKVAAAESIDANIDNKTTASKPASVQIAPKVAVSKPANTKIADAKAADLKATEVKTVEAKAPDDQLAEDAEKTATGYNASDDQQPAAEQKHPKQAEKHSPGKAHIEIVDTTPSTAQVDSVRDDIKTEIASEILALRASEETAKTAAAAAAAGPGPSVAAEPVTPVDKSSLKKLSAKKEAELPAKVAAAPLKAIDTPVKQAVDTPVKQADATPAKAAEAPVPLGSKAASVVPVTMTPVPLTVPKPVADKIAADNARIAAENAKVAAENAKLKNEVSTLEYDRADLSGRAALTSKVTAENSQLKNEVSTLEHDRADLSNNVILLKTLASTQAELATLKKNRDQTVTELEATLTAKDRQTQQLQSSLASALASKDAAIAAKEREVAAAKFAAGNSSKAVASAQAEIVSIKRDQIAKLTSLKQKTDDAFNALQANLDMKEKQRQELEEALNTKDKDLSSIRSLSSTDSKALDLAKKDLADAQAEIDGLKQEHDKTAAALQSKQAELQAKETEIDSLKHTGDQTLASLQAKLSEKTAQYDALKTQDDALAQEKNKLAQENNALVQEKTSLAQEKNGLVQEKTALVQEKNSLVQEKETAVLHEKEAEERIARVAPSTGTPANAAPVAADDIKSEIAAESLNTKPQQPRPESIDLKSLLLSSHVLSSQDIKAGDGDALHWSADGLFGSAQQSPLVPGKSLMDTAGDYLHKTASLCKGDFGQKIGQVESAGKLNVLEADITCIDGQNDAAAAVLFISNQGMFSVVTEEGTVDQLHTAMTNRDAIISAAMEGGADSRTQGISSDAPAAARPRLLQNNTAPYADESAPLASD